MTGFEFQHLHCVADDKGICPGAGSLICEMEITCYEAQMGYVFKGLEIVSGPKPTVH